MKSHSFVVYGTPTPYAVQASVAFNKKRQKYEAHMRERKTTREWKEVARDIIAAEMVHKEKLTGPLRFEVVAVFRLPKQEHRRGGVPWNWRPKTPDGSNILKACEDVCNETVFDDDRQLVDTRCYKVVGAQGVRPYTFIRVSTVAGVLPPEGVLP